MEPSSHRPLENFKPTGAPINQPKDQQDVKRRLPLPVPSPRFEPNSELNFDAVIISSDAMKQKALNHLGSIKDRLQNESINDKNTFTNFLTTVNPESNRKFQSPIIQEEINKLENDPDIVQIRNEIETINSMSEEKLNSLGKKVGLIEKEIENINLNINAENEKNLVKTEINDASFDRVLFLEREKILKENQKNNLVDFIENAKNKNQYIPEREKQLNSLFDLIAPIMTNLNLLNEKLGNLDGFYNSIKESLKTLSQEDFPNKNEFLGELRELVKGFNAKCREFLPTMCHAEIDEKFNSLISSFPDELSDWNMIEQSPESRIVDKAEDLQTEQGKAGWGMGYVMNIFKNLGR